MRRTVVLACCALIATTALVGNPAGASDEPRGTAAASTPPLWPMAAASVPFTNRTTGDGLGDNNVYGVYAVGATVYADLPVIRSHWMLTAWVLPFRNLTLRCSRLCGVAPW